MVDEVAAETDQRLEEAAVRVDKVLSDMEDLAPVSDALLATKRGLGDASKSIAGLADQAAAAMTQLKEALATLQSGAKALQDFSAETQEAAERLQATVESSSRETVENVASASRLLHRELVQARESAAEGMERLQATVESSSSETMEKVASASELVESTRQVFKAEFKRLRFLLFVGCGLGALVSALVIVQLLVP